MTPMSDFSADEDQDHVPEASVADADNDWAEDTEEAVQADTNDAPIAEEPVAQEPEMPDVSAAVSAVFAAAASQNWDDDADDLTETEDDWGKQDWLVSQNQAGRRRCRGRRSDPARRPDSMRIAASWAEDDGWSDITDEVRDATEDAGLSDPEPHAPEDRAPEDRARDDQAEAEAVAQIEDEDDEQLR